MAPAAISTSKSVVKAVVEAIPVESTFTTSR